MRADLSGNGVIRHAGGVVMKRRRTRAAIYTPQEPIAVLAQRRAGKGSLMSGVPSIDSSCRRFVLDAGVSSWPLASSLALGPLSEAVPCARMHTQHTLRKWQQTGVADVAELIVSELVTNAITATQAIGSLSPVVLWLHSDGSRTLILVGDGSPYPPQLINAAGDTEGGRGLVLVEALSSSWGWYATRERWITKVVWAKLCENETP